MFNTIGLYTVRHHDRSITFKKKKRKEKKASPLLRPLFKIRISDLKKLQKIQNIMMEMSFHPVLKRNKGSMHASDVFPD